MKVSKLLTFRTSENDNASWKRGIELSFVGNLFK